MAIVATICNLPRQLRTLGDTSFIDLFDASGYRQDPDALELAAVVKYLQDHPEFIEDWLDYSADQRCSPAWYVTDLDTGGFEVGFYPDGPRRVFADAATACAEFIMRYVAQFMTLE